MRWVTWTISRARRQGWSRRCGPDDAELRHHAANALAEIADPATTPALVELLSDRSSEIRRHAAEALGEIGTPDAVRALTRALEDGDPEVRRTAVEALADAKDND